MSKTTKRSLALAFIAGIITMLVIVAAIGCASPEQRADKLFNQGKYQGILDKYPDCPAAEKAKQMLSQGHVTGTPVTIMPTVRTSSDNLAIVMANLAGGCQCTLSDEKLQQLRAQAIHIIAVAQQ
jgi:hypothetical protein